MDDGFLIRQVLSGNREAFRLLVIRYQRPVFRFLGGFGVGQAVAEELAQETFLRAFRNLPSYDAGQGTFSAWLFAIAKHLAMHEAARGRRRWAEREARVEAEPTDASAQAKLEQAEGVIGLPGDRIEIDGSSVKVNGSELRREPVNDLGDRQLGRLLDDHVAYRESLDGASYTVLWRKDAARQNVSVTVPNGQVFVLGDNRSTSHDSREFGLLPLADVSGVARQISFSVGRDVGVRWRRTGHRLD